MKKILWVIIFSGASALFPVNSFSACEMEKEDLALFFLGGGGPPNIMWFMDSSGSMRDLPCAGNCDLTGGCGVSGNSSMVFRNLGYDPNTLYPIFYPQCSDYGGSGTCYDPCRVYLRSNGWGCGGDWWQDEGTVEDFCNDGSTASCSPTSGWFCDANGQVYPTETQCQNNCSGWQCSLNGQIYNNESQCQNNCTQSCNCSRVWWIYYRCDCTGNWYWGRRNCQNNCGTSGTCTSISGNCSYTSSSFTYSGQCATQLFQYGYIYSSGRYYFLGNLLNFYPPKYIVARKVFRDLIGQTQKIRQGLMTFDLQYYNSGAYVRSDLNPACNQIESDSAFYNNRQSLLNLLDGMDYDDFYTNTPIGEALMNIGQYFACNNVYSSYYGYSIKTHHMGQSNKCGTSTNARSICYKCQKNFAVLVTDGLPTQDCNEFNAGSDYDGDGNYRDYSGSRNHCLDDVAYNLYQGIDLKPDDYNASYGQCYAGGQNLSTYTVSFGLGQNIPQILPETASDGGGSFYSADTYQQLVDALMTILFEILKRSMSFTRASVEAIQTDDYTSGIVARFKPSDRTIWQGMLYKFDLFNEFLSDPKTDKNNDGDYKDILLVDKDDDIVTTNPDGDFVKQGSNNPANPYWEAGARLEAMGPDARNLHTVIDTNGDGVIDGSDSIIDFTTTNASQLEPYLKLTEPGFDDNYATACDYIADKLNTSLTSLQCAQYFIEFVRGKDIFDWDNDGSTNDSRPSMLGDIFHSSPMVVKTPNYVFFPNKPTDVIDANASPEEPSQYYCDPTVEPRCGLPSLWRIPVEDTIGNTKEAFFDYIRDTSNNNNEKFIVLTASNDGIFHAFDYDTGDEKWGFIPTFILPQLKTLLLKRCYLLDNTPWVREIWNDANSDNKKQSTEFRLITVVGQRRGGNHWFALDITDFNNPQFLWNFPKAIPELEGSVLNSPDTATEQRMGESWGENLPNAPPIVAIKELDNNGFEKDHYVVLLNAGFYPYEDTTPADIGRGFYIVDAYTGTNMWDFTYQAGDPVKQYLTNSVPGVVNARDVKVDPNTALSLNMRCGFSDCFADHIFFGDTGGNLWMVSISSAVTLNALGQIVNPSWQGVRFFKTDTGEPFYYTPTLYLAKEQQGSGSIETNFHLTIGTGNRYKIVDCDSPPAGTVNRLYNLILPSNFLNLSGYDPASISANPYHDSSFFGFPLSPTGSPPSQSGWYWEFQTAEKVVYSVAHLYNPHDDILYLLFSIFVPENCAEAGGGGGGGFDCVSLNDQYCGGGAKSGKSLLYLLNSETGEGAFPNNQPAVEVGKGLPTPPSIIKAIGTAGFSVSVLTGGAEGVPQSVQTYGSQSSFSMFYLLDLSSKPWLHNIRHNSNFKIP